MIGLLLLLSWAPEGLAGPTHLSDDTNHSDRRVALIIGNGQYSEAPLVNPPNDAQDMSTTLRSLGFIVLERRDLDQRAMKLAIREFGRQLRGASAGLFYFAGHGVQIKGTNYLIPIGTEISSEADAEDQSVALDFVVRTMEDSGVPASVLVLDACRNNPFARSFRSATRGLAQTQAATGMLIAYSTAPGGVAADGDGRNGLYTFHLIDRIQRGDGELLRTFQQVRAAVVKASGGKQTPWESSSLVGDFYFKLPGQKAVDEMLASSVTSSVTSLPSQAPGNKRPGPRRGSDNLPYVVFSRSNSGWSAQVSFPEPVTVLQWRLGDAGPYQQTPLTGQVDRDTRARIPQDWFTFSGDTPDSTLYIKAVNRMGEEIGPFPVKFNPLLALQSDQKRLLDMTTNAWLTLRRQSDKVLVYITHLLMYRCAIRAVRIGVGSVVPDQPLSLPACNPRDPWSTNARDGTSVPIYFSVPGDTPVLSLELSFTDGSTSPVQVFRP